MDYSVYVDMMQASHHHIHDACDFILGEQWLELSSFIVGDPLDLFVNHLLQINRFFKVLHHDVEVRIIFVRLYVAYDIGVVKHR